MRSTNESFDVFNSRDDIYLVFTKKVNFLFILYFLDDLQFIINHASSRITNKARSEQSLHTPGGSHQRLKHFQRKDKIVKDFIIPNQVVSEKTLIKNVHMCCISVKEKIENLKKVGKMRISTLIFIYTIHFAYLKVYTKFHNPNSSSC